MSKNAKANKQDFLKILKEVDLKSKPDSGLSSLKNACETYTKGKTDKNSKSFKYLKVIEKYCSQIIKEFAKNKIVKNDSWNKLEEALNEALNAKLGLSSLVSVLGDKKVKKEIQKIRDVAKDVQKENAQRLKSISKELSPKDVEDIVEKVLSEVQQGVTDINDSYKFMEKMSEVSQYLNRSFRKVGKKADRKQLQSVCVAALKSSKLTQDVVDKIVNDIPKPEPKPKPPLPPRLNVNEISKQLATKVEADVIKDAIETLDKQGKSSEEIVSILIEKAAESHSIWMETPYREVCFFILKESLVSKDMFLKTKTEKEIKVKAAKANFKQRLSTTEALIVNSIKIGIAAKDDINDFNVRAKDCESFSDIDELIYRVNTIIEKKTDVLKTLTNNESKLDSTFVSRTKIKLGKSIFIDNAKKEMEKLEADILQKAKSENPQITAFKQQITQNIDTWIKKNDIPKSDKDALEKEWENYKNLNQLQEFNKLLEDRYKKRKSFAVKIYKDKTVDAKKVKSIIDKLTATSIFSKTDLKKFQEEFNLLLDGQKFVDNFNDKYVNKKDNGYLFDTIDSINTIAQVCTQRSNADGDDWTNTIKYLTAVETAILKRKKYLDKIKKEENKLGLKADDFGSELAFTADDLAYDNAIGNKILEKIKPINVKIDDAIKLGYDDRYNTEGIKKLVTDKLMTEEESEKVFKHFTSKKTPIADFNKNFVMNYKKEISDRYENVRKLITDNKNKLDDEDLQGFTKDLSKYRENFFNDFDFNKFKSIAQSMYSNIKRLVSNPDDYTPEKYKTAKVEALIKADKLLQNESDIVCKHFSNRKYDIKKFETDFVDKYEKDFYEKYKEVYDLIENNKQQLGAKADQYVKDLNDGRTNFFNGKDLLDFKSFTKQADDLKAKINKELGGGGGKHFINNDLANTFFTTNKIKNAFFNDKNIQAVKEALKKRYVEEFDKDKYKANLNTVTENLQSKYVPLVKALSDGATKEQYKEKPFSQDNINLLANLDKDTEFKKFSDELEKYIKEVKAL